MKNKFKADLDLASDIENGKHLKAWDNLPEVQRRTILNADIYEKRKSLNDSKKSDPESEYKVPSKPSEGLMHILRCNTQARVHNYLRPHPKFVNNMFHADIGYCTALKMKCYKHKMVFVILQISALSFVHPQVQILLKQICCF